MVQVYVLLKMVYLLILQWDSLHLKVLQWEQDVVT